MDNDGDPSNWDGRANWVRGGIIKNGKESIIIYEKK